MTRRFWLMTGLLWVVLVAGGYLLARVADIPIAQQDAAFTRSAVYLAFAAALLAFATGGLGLSRGQMLAFGLIGVSLALAALNAVRDMGTALLWTERALMFAGLIILLNATHAKVSGSAPPAGPLPRA